MSFITNLLDTALARRQHFFDEEHYAAFRLFNGFYEGFPQLSIDIYARTALFHNYAETPIDDELNSAVQWLNAQLPWIQCIVCKARSAKSSAEKRATLLYGSVPDQKIREAGVWYSIDITMNRDASFYLDTRNVRAWAKTNLRGKTVLNTFAYTGSLGVAAFAGGAARVIQLDRNQNFLNLAKDSYALNGFSVKSRDFLSTDFFPGVSQLKKSGQLFDCIFLDPPFFASTASGRVDLETGSTKLINKIRPLVRHGGWIIAINNALFINGKDYLASLQALCADEYLSIEQLIPVPDDFTGSTPPQLKNSPTDPAPFNHSTKIAVLRVKRKSKYLLTADG